MARSRAPHLLGILFKLFFSLVIFGVCAVLVWRVFFSAKIPKEVKSLTPTPALTDAYETYGNGLVAQFQDQASITRGEKNYGYFSAVQVIFLPQANEVQLVFRYNDSTLEHLADDYSLSAVPKKSETLFDLSLVRTEKETGKEERFFPTASLTKRKETTLYTFYRYVFENISVEDFTEGVFLDIYYLGDVNYEKEAYGTLCLYDCNDVWLPYSLTSDDKKLLSGKS